MWAHRKFQTLLAEGLIDIISLKEICKNIISLEGNLTKSTKIKIVKALQPSNANSENSPSQIYLYMYTKTYT